MVMVYRKYPRRKTYGRKKSWYNKKYSTLQLARKAFAGVKYIRGLVNSEMFHVDTDISLTPTGSGSIINLTSLSQGDTSALRTGNSIYIRNLVFRGRAAINSSVTGNTRIRWMLIQDKQQVSDTTPSVSDIMSTTGPESLLNLSNSGRFSILKSSEFVLYPSGTNTQSVRLIDYYRKMSLHVRYNGTASTDIQRNGLYLVFISSETTNTPTISGTVRIGYRDN
jgi:hypothetical protein